MLLCVVALVFKSPRKDLLCCLASCASCAPIARLVQFVCPEAGAEARPPPHARQRPLALQSLSDSLSSRAGHSSDRATQPAHSSPLSLSLTLSHLSRVAPSSSLHDQSLRHFGCRCSAAGSASR